MFNGSLDINILSFIVIILLSFVGSLAKDYILLFNNKRPQNFRFGRIFFSTISAIIFSYCLEPIIISGFGFRGLIFFSFVSGLIGFEVLTKISSIRAAVKMLSMIFFSKGVDIKDCEEILKDKDKPPHPPPTTIREKIIVIKEKSDDKSIEEEIKKLIEKDGK